MNTQAPDLDPTWLKIAQPLPLPKSKLCRLLAPTGYGKTALAAYWFKHWPEKKAWLQLSPIDNELISFINHINSLLQLAELDLAHASKQSLQKIWLKQLEQWQQQATKMTLIVIDELQHIHNQDVLECIINLLSFPKIKAVLCSQQQHNKLFMAFKFKQQLCDISIQQLELNQAQIKLLLNKQLTQKQIEVLQEKLHGWPALWRMIAQLLEQGMRAEDIDIQSLSADVADYLVAQSIEPLNNELRELLYSLIVFEHFDKDLAALAYKNSHIQDYLLALKQQPVFLSPSNQQAGRWQFMPFFRQSLRHHLSLKDPQRLEMAAYRGVKALLQSQHYNEAAQLAIEQGSPELSKLCLQSCGEWFFHKAQYALIEQLFSHIKTKQLKAEPQLALLYSWLLLEGHKKSGECENFIKSLDIESWPSSVQARFDTVKAEIYYQFDLLDVAIHYAERALKNLNQHKETTSTEFTKAMAQLWLGHIPTAEQSLLKLLTQAHFQNQHHFEVAINLRLANIKHLQSDFQQALNYCAQAQKKVEELNLVNDHLNDAISRTQIELYIALAMFPEAEQTLEKGKLLDKPLGDYWWIAYKTLQLRLELLQAKSIHQLLAELEERTSKQVTCKQWRYRNLSTLQLCYRWQNNDEGLKRLQQQLQWHQHTNSVFDCQDNILYARNLVLNNKSLPDELAKLTKQWQQQGLLLLAQQAQCLIEFQTWQKQGQLPAANSAILLCIEQGYLWDLLMLGPQNIQLWQELLKVCKHSTQQSSSLNKLIELCTQSVELNKQTAEQATQIPNEVSELTPKEWTVLQAIAQGLSNEQISAQMYVALSTVKTHVNRIYRKLNLNNRAEAKALALSLKLK